MYYITVVLFEIKNDSIRVLVLILNAVLFDKLLHYLKAQSGNQIPTRKWHKVNVSGFLFIFSGFFVILMYPSIENLDG